MNARWYRALFPLLIVPGLDALPPSPGARLDAPVSTGTKVTYAELLRLVCPDLKVDEDDPTSGAATRAIAIRELGSAEEPKPQDDATITVQSVNTVALVKPALKAATPRVLVTFIMPIDGDESERMLAVFDIGATPQLLDAVRVPQFPDDTGSCTEVLHINGSTDAFVFEGVHFNSQQGYDNYMILFVRDDRVELIEQQAALSCRGCASGDFEESLKLATMPDPGRAYNKIVIRVTFKQLPDPPDSEHRPRRRPFTRFYTAEYRWDAQGQRFTTMSKELAQLDNFNKDNY